MSDVTVGLLVRIEALPGKQEDVAAFLRSGLALVLEEPDTTSWFAMRMGPTTFGIFDAFLDDDSVALYGFEAAGDGVDTPRHAATISKGRPGVLHGARSYLLQDDDGQTIESHSISAGLDYPGVGPEHAWLADIGRASYLPITDAAAMAAMRLLSRTEGIIPAIESAHALAGVLDLGARLGPRATILANLSGRGDKDMETAGRYFDILDTNASQS